MGGFDASICGQSVVVLKAREGGCFFFFAWWQYLMSHIMHIKASEQVYRLHFLDISLRSKEPFRRHGLSSTFLKATKVMYIRSSICIGSWAGHTYMDFHTN